MDSRDAKCTLDLTTVTALNDIAWKLPGANWWTDPNHPKDEGCLYWLRVPNSLTKPDEESASKNHHKVGSLQILRHGQSTMIAGIRLAARNKWERICIETTFPTFTAHWKVLWTDSDNPAELRVGSRITVPVAKSIPIQLGPDVHMHGWVSGRVFTAADDVINGSGSRTYRWCFMVPVPIRQLTYATVLLLPPERVVGANETTTTTTTVAARNLRISSVLTAASTQQRNTTPPTHVMNASIRQNFTATPLVHYTCQIRQNARLTCATTTKTIIDPSSNHSVKTRLTDNDDATAGDHNHPRSNEIAPERATSSCLTPLLALLEPSSRLVMLVQEAFGSVPSRETTSNHDQRTDTNGLRLSATSPCTDRTHSLTRCTRDQSVVSGTPIWSENYYTHIRTKDGLPACTNGASISPKHVTGQYNNNNPLSTSPMEFRTRRRRRGQSPLYVATTTGSDLDMPHSTPLSSEQRGAFRESPSLVDMDGYIRCSSPQFTWKTFMLKQLDVISTQDSVPPPWMVKMNRNRLPSQKSSDRSWSTIGTRDSPIPAIDTSTFGIPIHIDRHTATEDLDDLEISPPRVLLTRSPQLPLDMIDRDTQSASSLEETNARPRDTMLVEIFGSLNAFAEEILTYNQTLVGEPSSVNSSLFSSLPPEAIAVRARREEARRARSKKLANLCNRISTKLEFLCDGEEDEEEGMQDPDLQANERRLFALRGTTTGTDCATSAICVPLPNTCRVTSPMRLLACQFDLLCELAELQTEQEDTNLHHQDWHSNLIATSSSLLTFLDRLPRSSEEDHRKVLHLSLRLQLLLSFALTKANETDNNWLFLLNSGLTRLDQTVRTPASVVTDRLDYVITRQTEHLMSMEHTRLVKQLQESRSHDVESVFDRVQSIQSLLLGPINFEGLCRTLSSTSSGSIELQKSSYSNFLRPNAWSHLLHQCQTTCNYMEQYLREPWHPFRLRSGLLATGDAKVSRRVPSSLVDWQLQEMETWRGTSEFLKDNFSPLAFCAQLLETVPDPRANELVERMHQLHTDAMQRASDMVYFEQLCMLPGGIHSLAQQMTELANRITSLRLPLDDSSWMQTELALRHLQHQLCVECAFLAMHLSDEPTSSRDIQATTPTPSAQWLAVWTEQLSNAYHALVVTWECQVQNARQRVLDQAIQAWTTCAEDCLNMIATSVDPYTPQSLLMDENAFPSLWTLLLDAEYIQSVAWRVYTTTTTSHMTSTRPSSTPEWTNELTGSLLHEVNRHVDFALNACRLTATTASSNADLQLISLLLQRLEQSPRPNQRLHQLLNTAQNGPGAQETDQLRELIHIIGGLHIDWERRWRLTQRSILIVNELKQSLTSTSTASSLMGPIVCRWLFAMGLRRDWYGKLHRGLKRILGAAELVDAERFPLGLLSSWETRFVRRELLRQEQVFLEALRFGLEAVNLEGPPPVCDPQTPDLMRLSASQNVALEKLKHLFQRMLHDPRLGQTHDLTLPRDKFTSFIVSRVQEARRLYGILQPMVQTSWTLLEAQGSMVESIETILGGKMQSDLKVTRRDWLDGRRRELSRRMERVSSRPRFLPYTAGCSWTPISLHPDPNWLTPTITTDEWMNALRAEEQELQNNLSFLIASLPLEMAQSCDDAFDTSQLEQIHSDLEHFEGLELEKMHKLVHALFRTATSHPYYFTTEAVFIETTFQLAENKTTKLWSSILQDRTGVASIVPVYFQKTMAQLQELSDDFSLCQPLELGDLEKLTELIVQVATLNLIAKCLQRVLDFLPPGSVLKKQPSWLETMFQSLEQLITLLPPLEFLHLVGSQKDVEVISHETDGIINFLSTQRGHAMDVNSLSSLQDWMEWLPTWSNENPTDAESPIVFKRRIREQLGSHRRLSLLTEKVMELWTHLLDAESSPDHLPDNVTATQDSLIQWSVLYRQYRALVAQDLSRSTTKTQKPSSMDSWYTSLLLDMARELIGNRLLHHEYGLPRRTTDDRNCSELQFVQKTDGHVAELLDVVRRLLNPVASIHPSWSRSHSKMIDLFLQLPSRMTIAHLLAKLTLIDQNCFELRRRLMDYSQVPCYSIDWSEVTTLSRPSADPEKDELNQLLECLTFSLPNESEIEQHADRLIRRGKKLRSLISALSDHVDELSAVKHRLNLALPNLTGFFVDELTEAVDEMEKTAQLQRGDDNSAGRNDRGLGEQIKHAGQRLMELETCLEHGSETTRFILLIGRGIRLSSSRPDRSTSRSDEGRANDLCTDYERTTICSQIRAAWHRLADLGDRLGRMQAGLPARRSSQNSEGNVEELRNSSELFINAEKSELIRCLQSQMKHHSCEAPEFKVISKQRDAELVRRELLGLRDLLGSHTCVYPECKQARKDWASLPATDSLNNNNTTITNTTTTTTNEQVRSCFIDLIHFYARLKKDLIEQPCPTRREDSFTLEQSGSTPSTLPVRQRQWNQNVQLSKTYRELMHRVCGLRGCGLPQVNKLQEKAESLEKLWHGEFDQSNGVEYIVGEDWTPDYSPRNYLNGLNMETSPNGVASLNDPTNGFHSSSSNSSIDPVDVDWMERTRGVIGKSPPSRTCLGVSRDDAIARMNAARESRMRQTQTSRYHNQQERRRRKKKHDPLGIDQNGPGMSDKKATDVQSGEVCVASVNTGDKKTFEIAHVSQDSSEEDDKQDNQSDVPIQITNQNTSIGDASKGSYKMLKKIPQPMATSTPSVQKPIKLTTPEETDNIHQSLMSHDPSAIQNSLTFIESPCSTLIGDTTNGSDSEWVTVKRTKGSSKKPMKKLRKPARGLKKSPESLNHEAGRKNNVENEKQDMISDINVLSKQSNEILRNSDEDKGSQITARDGEKMSEEKELDKDTQLGVNQDGLDGTKMMSIRTTHVVEYEPRLNRAYQTITPELNISNAVINTTDMMETPTVERIPETGPSDADGDERMEGTDPIMPCKMVSDAEDSSSTHTENDLKEDRLHPCSDDTVGNLPISAHASGDECDSADDTAESVAAEKSEDSRVELGQLSVNKDGTMMMSIRTTQVVEYEPRLNQAHQTITPELNIPNVMINTTDMMGTPTVERIPENGPSDAAGNERMEGTDPTMPCKTLSDAEDSGPAHTGDELEEDRLHPCSDDTVGKLHTPDPAHASGDGCDATDDPAVSVAVVEPEDIGVADAEDDLVNDSACLGSGDGAARDVAKQPAPGTGRKRRKRGARSARDSMRSDADSDVVTAAASPGDGMAQLPGSTEPLRESEKVFPPRLEDGDDESNVESLPASPVMEPIWMESGEPTISLDNVTRASEVSELGDQAADGPSDAAGNERMEGTDPTMPCKTLSDAEDSGPAHTGDELEEDRLHPCSDDTVGKLHTPDPAHASGDGCDATDDPAVSVAVVEPEDIGVADAEDDLVNDSACLGSGDGAARDVAKQPAPGTGRKRRKRGARSARDSMRSDADSDVVTAAASPGDGMAQLPGSTEPLRESEKVFPPRLEDGDDESNVESLPASPVMEPIWMESGEPTIPLDNVTRASEVSELGDQAADGPSDAAGNERMEGTDPTMPCKTLSDAEDSGPAHTGDELEEDRLHPCSDDTVGKLHTPDPAHASGDECDATDDPAVSVAVVEPEDIGVADAEDDLVNDSACLGSGDGAARDVAEQPAPGTGRKRRKRGARSARDSMRSDADSDVVTAAASPGDGMAQLPGSTEPLRESEKVFPPRLEDGDDESNVESLPASPVMEPIWMESGEPTISLDNVTRASEVSELGDQAADGPSDAAGNERMEGTDPTMPCKTLSDAEDSGPAHTGDELEEDRLHPCSDDTVGKLHTPDPAHASGDECDATDDPAVSVAVVEPEDIGVADAEDDLVNDSACLGSGDGAARDVAKQPAPGTGRKRRKRGARSARDSMRSDADSDVVTAVASPGDGMAQLPGSTEPLRESEKVFPPRLEDGDDESNVESLPASPVMEPIWMESGEPTISLDNVTRASEVSELGDQAADGPSDAAGNERMEGTDPTMPCKTLSDAEDSGPAHTGDELEEDRLHPCSDDTVGKLHTPDPAHASGDGCDATDDPAVSVAVVEPEDIGVADAEDDLVNDSACLGSGDGAARDVAKQPAPGTGRKRRKRGARSARDSMRSDADSDVVTAAASPGDGMAQLPGSTEPLRESEKVFPPRLEDGDDESNVESLPASPVMEPIWMESGEPTIPLDNVTRASEVSELGDQAADGPSDAAGNERMEGTDLTMPCKTLSDAEDSGPAHTGDELEEDRLHPCSDDTVGKLHTPDPAHASGDGCDATDDPAVSVAVVEPEDIGVADAEDDLVNDSACLGSGDGAARDVAKQPAPGTGRKRRKRGARSARDSMRSDADSDVVTAAASPGDGMAQLPGSTEPLRESEKVFPPRLEDGDDESNVESLPASPVMEPIWMESGEPTISLDNVTRASEVSEFGDQAADGPSDAAGNERMEGTDPTMPCKTLSDAEDSGPAHTGDELEEDRLHPCSDDTVGKLHTPDPAHASGDECDATDDPAVSVAVVEPEDIGVADAEDDLVNDSACLGSGDGAARDVAKQPAPGTGRKRRKRGARSARDSMRSDADSDVVTAVASPGDGMAQLPGSTEPLRESEKVFPPRLEDGDDESNVESLPASPVMEPIWMESGEPTISLDNVTRASEVSEFGDQAADGPSDAAGNERMEGTDPTMPCKTLSDAEDSGPAHTGDELEEDRLHPCSDDTVGKLHTPDPAHASGDECDATDDPAVSVAVVEPEDIGVADAEDDLVNDSACLGSGDGAARDVAKQPAPGTGRKRRKRGARSARDSMRSDADSDVVTAAASPGDGMAQLPGSTEPLRESEKVFPPRLEDGDDESNVESLPASPVMEPIWMESGEPTIPLDNVTRASEVSELGDQAADGPSDAAGNERMEGTDPTMPCKTLSDAEDSGPAHTGDELEEDRLHPCSDDTVGKLHTPDPAHASGDGCDATDDPAVSVAVVEPEDIGVADAEDDLVNDSACLGSGDGAARDVAKQPAPGTGRKRRKRGARSARDSMRSDADSDVVTAAASPGDGMAQLPGSTEPLRESEKVFPPRLEDGDDESNVESLPASPVMEPIWMESGEPTISLDNVTRASEVSEFGDQAADGPSDAAGNERMEGTDPTMPCKTLSDAEDSGPAHTGDELEEDRLHPCSDDTVGKLHTPDPAHASGDECDATDDPAVSVAVVEPEDIGVADAEDDLVNDSACLGSGDGAARDVAKQPAPGTGRKRRKRGARSARDSMRSDADSDVVTAAASPGDGMAQLPGSTEPLRESGKVFPPRLEDGDDESNVESLPASPVMEPIWMESGEPTIPLDNVTRASEVSELGDQAADGPSDAAGNERMEGTDLTMPCKTLSDAEDSGPAHTGDELEEDRLHPCSDDTVGKLHTPDPAHASGDGCDATDDPAVSVAVVEPEDIGVADAEDDLVNDSACLGSGDGAARDVAKQPAPGTGRKRRKRGARSARDSMRSDADSDVVTAAASPGDGMAQLPGSTEPLRESEKVFPPRLEDGDDESNVESLPASPVMEPIWMESGEPTISLDNVTRASEVSEFGDQAADGPSDAAGNERMEGTDPTMPCKTLSDAADNGPAHTGDELEEDRLHPCSDDTVGKLHTPDPAHASGDECDATDDPAVSVAVVEPEDIGVADAEDDLVNDSACLGSGDGAARDVAKQPAPGTGRKRRKRGARSARDSMRSDADSDVVTAAASPGDGMAQLPGSTEPLRESEKVFPPRLEDGDDESNVESLPASPVMEPIWMESGEPTIPLDNVTRASEVSEFGDQAADGPSDATGNERMEGTDPTMPCKTLSDAEDSGPAHTGDELEEDRLHPCSDDTVGKLHTPDPAHASGDECDATDDPAVSVAVVEPEDIGVADAEDDLVNDSACLGSGDGAARDVAKQPAPGTGRKRRKRGARSARDSMRSDADSDVITAAASPGDGMAQLPGSTEPLRESEKVFPPRLEDGDDESNVESLPASPVMEPIWMESGEPTIPLDNVIRASEVSELGDQAADGPSDAAGNERMEGTDPTMPCKTLSDAEDSGPAHTGDELEEDRLHPCSDDTVGKLHTPDPAHASGDECDATDDPAVSVAVVEPEDIGVADAEDDLVNDSACLGSGDGAARDVAKQPAPGTGRKRRKRGARSARDSMRSDADSDVVTAAASPGDGMAQLPGSTEPLRESEKVFPPRLEDGDDESNVESLPASPVMEPIWMESGEPTISLDNVTRASEVSELGDQAADGPSDAAGNERMEGTDPTMPCKTLSDAEDSGPAHTGDELEEDRLHPCSDDTVGKLHTPDPAHASGDECDATDDPAVSVAVVEPEDIGVADAEDDLVNDSACLGSGDGAARDVAKQPAPGTGRKRRKRGARSARDSMRSDADSDVVTAAASPGDGMAQLPGSTEPLRESEKVFPPRLEDGDDESNVESLPASPVMEPIWMESGEPTIPLDNVTRASEVSELGDQAADGPSDAAGNERMEGTDPTMPCKTLSDAEDSGPAHTGDELEEDRLHPCSDDTVGKLHTPDPAHASGDECDATDDPAVSVAVVEPEDIGVADAEDDLVNDSACLGSGDGTARDVAKQPAPGTGRKRRKRGARSARDSMRSDADSDVVTAAASPGDGMAQLPGSTEPLRESEKVFPPRLEDGDDESNVESLPASPVMEPIWMESGEPTIPLDNVIRASEVSELGDQAADGPSDAAGNERMEGTDPTMPCKTLSDAEDSGPAHTGDELEEDRLHPCSDDTVGKLHTPDPAHASGDGCDATDDPAVSVAVVEPEDIGVADAEDDLVNDSACLGSGDGAARDVAKQPAPGTGRKRRKRGARSARDSMRSDADSDVVTAAASPGDGMAQLPGSTEPLRESEKVFPPRLEDGDDESNVESLPASPVMEPIWMESGEPTISLDNVTRASEVSEFGDQAADGPSDAAGNERMEGTDPTMPCKTLSDAEDSGPAHTGDELEEDRLHPCSDDTVGKLHTPDPAHASGDECDATDDPAVSVAVVEPEDIGVADAEDDLVNDSACLGSGDGAARDVAKQPAPGTGRKRRKRGARSARDSMRSDADSDVVTAAASPGDGMAQLPGSTEPLRESEKVFPPRLEDGDDESNVESLPASPVMEPIWMESGEPTIPLDNVTRASEVSELGDQAADGPSDAAGNERMEGTDPTMPCKTLSDAEDSGPAHTGDELEEDRLHPCSDDTVGKLHTPDPAHASGDGCDATDDPAVSVAVVEPEDIGVADAEDDLVNDSACLGSGDGAARDVAKQPAPGTGRKRRKRGARSARDSMRSDADSDVVTAAASPGDGMAQLPGSTEPLRESEKVFPPRLEDGDDESNVESLPASPVMEPIWMESGEPTISLDNVTRASEVSEFGDQAADGPSDAAGNERMEGTDPTMPCKTLSDAEDSGPAHTGDELEEDRLHPCSDDTVGKLHTPDPAHASGDGCDATDDPAVSVAVVEPEDIGVADAEDDLVNDSACLGSGDGAARDVAKQPAPGTGRKRRKRGARSARDSMRSDADSDVVTAAASPGDGMAQLPGSTEPLRESEKVFPPRLEDGDDESNVESLPASPVMEPILMESDEPTISLDNVTRDPTMPCKTLSDAADSGPAHTSTSDLSTHLEPERGLSVNNRSSYDFSAIMGMIEAEAYLIQSSSSEPSPCSSPNITNDQRSLVDVGSTLPQLSKTPFTVDRAVQIQCPSLVWKNKFGHTLSEGGNESTLSVSHEMSTPRDHDNDSRKAEKCVQTIQTLDDFQEIDKSELDHLIVYPVDAFKIDHKLQKLPEEEECFHELSDPRNSQDASRCSCRRLLPILAALFALLLACALLLCFLLNPICGLWWPFWWPNHCLEQTVLWRLVHHPLKLLRMHSPPV